MVSQTHECPGSGHLDVCIVVPHYNDLQNLVRCLDSLEQQTLGRGTFEIVVADNNSTCDAGQLADICRNVRLITAPIQGAAEARNAGVAAATAPNLAFIDSDCLARPDWLESGLRALQTAPLVGGRVIVSTEASGDVTPVEAFERIFAFNNERYIREEKFSVTANMFTTRAVFDHVGGFRNGVSEDTEWGQRAASLGYAWRYAPEACLDHPARRTWAELTRKWKRLMRETFALERERGRSVAYWLTRNWLVLLTAPLAVAKALGSGEVSSMGDRVNAASILVRLRLWRLIEAHRIVLRSATYRSS